jgi:small subunit ribosomal protein S20
VANIRSALKRIRQNETRRVRNAAVRSSVRTAVKAAAGALAAPDQPAEAAAAVARTVRTLDKAVAKGVVPKNAAARKKSRLMRRLNALQAPAR